MASLLPGIVPAGALPRAIANSTSVMQTALGSRPGARRACSTASRPVVPFVVATAMFLVASLSVIAIPRLGAPRRSASR